MNAAFCTTWDKCKPRDKGRRTKIDVKCLIPVHYSGSSHVHYINIMLLVNWLHVVLVRFWFTNFLKYIVSDDMPSTTHKLLMMWTMTLEYVWTTGFPSSEKILFLPHRVLHYRQQYMHKCIEGDSCHRSCYFLWFMLMLVLQVARKVTIFE